MSLFTKVRHGWNLFVGRDPTKETKELSVGNYVSYGSRPDRVILSKGNDRSIINTIYNRIALDVAAAKILHARVDSNGKFKEEIHSDLDNCLTLEANIDQTGRDLILDIALSVMDEGVIAVVPVEADYNIYVNDTFKIYELRTGKITQWYPGAVRIKLYDERDGQQKEVLLPKDKVAIITNPFYSVMNEPNSTLKRLVRSLSLLDAVDERTGAGKLDIIIKLPYVVKTEVKRQQAEHRRKLIEEQLEKSDYGIAYIDGTEQVVQLNRPMENTLQSRVKELQATLYSQLGITEEILNGTASEETMLNYYSRTIEPMLSAIADEFKRKFLTKTARTQGQSIWFFRDPFKLVPVSKVADIADKFTRNEILSSNEIRAIIGYKPVDDPQADALRNKNLNQSTDENAPAPAMVNDEYDDYGGEEDDFYNY